MSPPRTWRPGTAAGGRTHPYGTRRAAVTLVELLIVLALFAVLLGLAFPRLAGAADRAAVRAALLDAGTVFAAARDVAIHRRAAVAVRIDTVAGAVQAQLGVDVLLRRDLRAAYGVRLATTRDSMAFDARGLGVGTANLSLVARRGGSVDTLFVSRLGRIRR